MNICKKVDWGCTYILVAAMLVVAVVASGAVYVWQQHTVHDLGNKNKILTTQAADALSQLAVLRAQLDDACPSTGNPACARFTYTSAKGVTALVYTPARNAAVASPVVVLGQVPGNWSFEAEFPVELKNAAGTVVAHAPARLLGDWQTTQLVPFTVVLPYTTTESGSGTIVLHNDNPSGLPEKADTISLPIHF